MPTLNPRSKPRELLKDSEQQAIEHIPEPDTARPRVRDIDFDAVATKPPRLPKLFKKYPKQECAEEGCTNWAVGSDVLCKYHGGDPIIRENLLENEHIPIKLLGTYKPEYHPMAYLNYAKQGLSQVEIAAEFGVSVNSLKNWSETFLDFNTVYEIGQALHEAWYITEAKENLDNRNYNTNLFKLLTGNVLGWSEKTESKSLNVHAGVLVVPERMTEADWEEVNGD